MENWYALKITPNKEEEAADLIRRTIDSDLWEYCRVPRKQKLYRADGKLVLVTERMFPGYLFLKTNEIQKIREVLDRSRQYPKILGDGRNQAIRMEEEDLKFLKMVCGEQLEHPMGLSEVEVDEAGNLIRVKGVLKPYSKSIVKKRLRKRYVLAEVELFRRQVPVLFGIKLPNDQIMHEQFK